MRDKQITEEYELIDASDVEAAIADASSSDRPRYTEHDWGKPVGERKVRP